MKNKQQIQVLHVTHNDMDAVGCDIMVRLYCQEKLGIVADSEKIKTCWCNAAEASDIVIKELEQLDKSTLYKLSSVFITDISITCECAKKLEQLSEVYGFTLRLFDHHQTNQLHKEFRWCTVILDSPPISATMILLNEFSEWINVDKYPGIRLFCEKVSRYDTWLWKKSPTDYSEENYSILCKFYGAEAYSRRIVRNHFNTSFTEFDKIILERFKKNRDKDIFAYVNTAKIAFVPDGTLTIAYILYTGEHANSVMEAIYEKYKDVDIVAGIIPQTRQLSFRTNKPFINVAEYAKKNYGGGGHASAAGAMWIDTERYLEILKEYYNYVGKRRDASEL